MKNIKFRAYNLRDKKMHYDITGFEFFGDGNMSGVFIDGVFFLIGEVELMQYTGLKDKNGKEIYEGDKVELDEEIGIIEWDNESSRFVIAFDTWVTDFDHEYGKDLEIVGTIYDNADLLEKASDENV